MGPAQVLPWKRDSGRGLKLGVGWGWWWEGQKGPEGAPELAEGRMPSDGCSYLWPSLAFG